MNLHFLSLASGSSGNCYYLGTDSYGILIDAGIGPRSIKKALKEYSIPFERIIALLITHDHTDHIKYAGVLGEKFAIPVYTTSRIHEGMNRNYSMTEKIYSARRDISKEVTFSIRDLQITAFNVSHDGTDNVGYTITLGDASFGIATDIGMITESVTKHLSKVQHLVIESNYDVEMLQNGKYPAHLKQRIHGDFGHLSNQDCALFISSIADEHLKCVYLCHISKDNNHPELAFKTIEMKLADFGIRIGKDFDLIALKRNTPTGVFHLN
ncbi:MAG: MBL fold metallo-hydrolase [Bacteroidales bacterium]